MTNTTFAEGSPEAIAIERLARIIAMPEGQGLEKMAMVMFANPTMSLDSVREAFRLARQTGPVSATAQPERARADAFMKAGGVKIDHGWSKVMAHVNAGRGAKMDAASESSSGTNHGWAAAIARVNASRR